MMAQKTVRKITCSVTGTSTPELPPPTVSATILNNTDKPDEPLMKVILSIYGAGRERVICHGTEISFPVAGQRVDLRRC